MHTYVLMCIYVHSFLNQFGRTALSFATWGGIVEILQILLQQQADPNISDVVGTHIILCYCCVHAHIHMNIYVYIYIYTSIKLVLK